MEKNLTESTMNSKIKASPFRTFKASPFLHENLTYDFFFFAILLNIEYY